MKKLALLTGGAGFIGCHLSKRLLEQGYDVVAADVLHSQVHTSPGRPLDLPPGVTLAPIDVTSAASVAALVRTYRPALVVHLAAETGTGQSLLESHRHVSVNVDGLAILLDALSAAGHVPEHFVLTSSRAVYGDGAWREASGKVFYPEGRSRKQLESGTWDYLGTDGRVAMALPSLGRETHPNPISVYGATKLAQEHVLAAWCRAFGSALSICRLQNVYGPGQAPGNPYTGVLVFFARVAKDGRALDVYEDGEIIRDFVHVEDVVDALGACIRRPPTGVRILDIGSGRPRTISEAAAIVAGLYRGPAPVVSGRFRDGDVRAASCSIDAARAEIGYAPRWDLEAGLESLVAWLDRAI